MTMMGRPGRAEGVGVMYHPFLHDYLLERTGLFDFIGLPLDLYADPARSTLLDPGQMRLRQVIAAKPCAWRGSALSLGSVEPGFPPHLVKTVRRLLEMTPAAPYTEVIGFRVPGHGAAQAMPSTPAAARWIARRQAAAQAALAVPVQLSLPTPTRGATADGLDLLARISAKGGTGFVVDAADLDTASPGRIPVPASQISALCVSSDDAPAWDRLSALAAQVKPRTVILCRDRQLFPLDTIERDLHRARSLVTVPAEETHSPAAGSGAGIPECPDASDLADLLEYQRAAQPSPSVGAAAESWRNWRTQVDDMHKAQQIAALLSRGSGPSPSWRA